MLDTERTGSGASVATPGVEYSRRLYDDVLGWYHNADAKAQVVPGLNGAFLAAAAFQDPSDLTSLTAQFSPWTWRLLGLMGAALVASIASAIYCLWSPLYFRPSAVVDRLRATSKARNERRSSTANPPGVMWFFQLVSVLDRAGFRTTLAAVDASFEIDVLASRITALSANVRRKHLAANIGFALAALTLMLFAASALTYVVAVTAAR